MQLKIFSILLGLVIISISVAAAYSDTIVGLDTRCFELLVPPPLLPIPPETDCDEGTGLDKDASLIALLIDFGIGVCDPVADPGWSARGAGPDQRPNFARREWFGR